MCYRCHDIMREKEEKNKKEIRKSFTIGNVSKYPWRINFYGEFGGMASSGGAEISFFLFYLVLEFWPFSSRFPLSYTDAICIHPQLLCRGPFEARGGMCLPY